VTNKNNPPIMPALGKNFGKLAVPEKAILSRTGKKKCKNHPGYGRRMCPG